MWVACVNGRLSVCKWLFEVGAATHITKVNIDGETPMFSACKQGQLSVCKWLILNGAFESSNTQTKKNIEKYRYELLDWSYQIINEHNAFRLVFLPGTLCTEQRKCSSHLWMLNSNGTPFKELIAEYAGVEYGIHLRNVRKLVEALDNSHIFKYLSYFYGSI